MAILAIFQKVRPPSGQGFDLSLFGNVAKIAKSPSMTFFGWGWRSSNWVMTSGTSTPGADFFSAVRDGVREAARATVTARELRLVPESAPEPGASAAEGEETHP